MRSEVRWIKGVDLHAVEFRRNENGVIGRSSGRDWWALTQSLYSIIASLLGCYQ